MKKIIIMTIIVLFTFVLSGYASAKELILAGSTTVQKRVLEPAGSAVKQATGIELKVLGINSGRGFAELVDGIIVASVSSSPLKDLLEKAAIPDDGTYQEHIIIDDVIVPIVNKSNPVSELTWQQLSDINTGKITNWKEVGGPDQIIIVVTSQPTAATRTIFQKIVMNKAPYAKRSREVKSTRQEVDLVSKYTGGIGAVSEAFVKMNPGKVKVLGTQSISRPLTFITKGNPNADVQAVIDFLRTPDAMKLYK